MTGKFDRAIKDIYESNDFFKIDYEDLLENFDTDDTDEKEKIGLSLSVVNIAFVDSVRGLISRPRYINEILSIYRKEFIEDVRNRLPEKEKGFKNNDNV